MRPLWTFLFLGCLFNTSRALLGDYSVGIGNVWDNVGLDTGSLLSNEGNPLEEYQEYINLGDDIKTLTEVSGQSLKLAMPSIPPVDVTLPSSVKIPGVSQDIVGEYSQQITSVLDSLDTSVVTSQEGLVGVIFLNNQDLVKEREELLMFLQGSSSPLGDTDGLLEAAGPDALKGLLCKGDLGGLCGHGSLAGMNDVLKNTTSEKLNSWVNVTNFNIVQVSWRVSATGSLELQFQTKLTVSFLGRLMLLSGSTVDVNILVPFGLQQTEFGQVKFDVKECQTISTRIQVRTGVLSKVMKSMLKASLNISLPKIVSLTTCSWQNLDVSCAGGFVIGSTGTCGLRQPSGDKGQLCARELCPVVRFWFYIINQQLDILKTISSLGALENVSLPDSQGPLLYERSYHLDFKDKRFPASFINWLIKRPSL